LPMTVPKDRPLIDHWWAGAFMWASVLCR
jgi:hypothetical protein